MTNTFKQKKELVNIMITFFVFSVFSIHLFAILKSLYIVTYLVFYLYMARCLIESQRLMFKKSDTLSLIELHFVMIVTMATQFTLL